MNADKDSRMAQMKKSRIASEIVEDYFSYLEFSNVLDRGM